jgi:hypothetical protein
MLKRLIVDPLLVIGYILGAILGLVILGSISPDRLIQHAVMLSVGLFLLLYFSSQEVSVYKSFAPLTYIGSLLEVLQAGLISVFFAFSLQSSLSRS